MKSFHKLMSEVAEPKAGDEKRFKAKHIVTKIDYPVDVDDQFTGGKTVKKAPKRKADLEAGEDEKVYEAMDPVNAKELKGTHAQRKDKDINNDGKVDSSDKYLHTRRKAIANAITKEEVEQLDELSPNTLHSYIKKAAGNMAGNAAVAAAQASSSMKKSSPDVKRKIKNRMQGITGASGRLADKANMAENAYEEIPMMMSQLEFISYAAEEIIDYLDMVDDPEEWYQNKLANVHQSMMSLYSYARGEMRMSSRSSGSGYYDDMYGEEAELDEAAPKIKADFVKTQREKDRAHDAAMGRTPTGRKKVMTSTQKSMASMRKEEVDLDESITKMSHGRLKFHMNSGVPHGSYTKDEMKAERDRRLKTDPMGYRSAKAGLNEVTQTAMKKTVTYIDPKGHSRTRDVPVKRVDKDEHGQDKIRESVEILDEAFKVGLIKLNDGASIVLKKEDVDLLNKMFKDLSTSNRKKMQEVAMKDKTGFNEILSFAREAI